MFGLRYSAITLGSRGAVRRKGGARTSSPRWLDQIELSCTDEAIGSKLWSAILTWVIVSKLHQPDGFDSQKDFCNKDPAAF